VKELLKSNSVCESYAQMKKGPAVFDSHCSVETLCPTDTHRGLSYTRQDLQLTVVGTTFTYLDNCSKSFFQPHCRRVGLLYTCDVCS